MRLRGTLILAALLVAGCNLGLPQPTPTLAPTRTTSVAPTTLPTYTPSSTPSITPVPPTPTVSVTPTTSPTTTPSFTATQTTAPSPTRTPTPIPTSTPTPSQVPTLTPLPAIGPTRTPLPTAAPTLTPSATIGPAITPIPALTAAATPASFSPVGERPQEFPQPTILATPTFVTAQPVLVTTSSPTVMRESVPTPSASPQTAAPATTLTIATVGSGPSPSPSTLAYALSTANNGFAGALLNMPGGTFAFAQSPLDPNHIALVDARGLLFVFSDFARRAGSRIDSSPFASPEPQSAELNNARVRSVAYSPDGRYLAFHVDTDSDASGDNDSSNDGVWFISLDPGSGSAIGGASALLRDCPPEPGCAIVERPDSPYRYRSLTIAWSPQSDAILVELDLPEEGRRGFTVVSPMTPNAGVRPAVLRYDYAAWSDDGAQLIVSGRGPDGRAVVGILDRAGASVRLTDAAGLGLAWAQNAVERPNGQVVFLGGKVGPGGSLRVYDTSGTALTPPIGGAAPLRAVWSPDRSAVMVVTQENGRLEYYVALLSTGQVSQFTAQIAGAFAVEWVVR